jgi:hypothetical protein
MTNAPEALPDEDQLTPAQERAVIALLSSSSLEEAAKAARVSVSSLRRWRQEPAFQVAYRHARFALLESATAKLRGAACRAVEVLVEAMNDKEAPHSVRIRAAQVVLESAYKSAEVEDLAERLEAQEQELESLARFLEKVP